ncbi:MAG: DNA primase [Anaerolineales bacterium]
MSVTDEIKDRIDIVDLVSESVELRRTGRNFTGFCPFHHNVNTPAFVVFTDTQTWRCFSECDEGGDIFSFTMKKEGWEFSEALQHLAERAGVQLKPLTPQAIEQKEEGERLRGLLEDVVVYYRHQLTQTEAGKVAAAYLQKRELTKDTIEAFGLGYAPNAWDSALEYFLSKGYTVEELEEAGLLSEREGGGYYDRFRNRLMIPIRDRSGKMAGFGARILNPDDMPKYLNSPQTPIFDKSRLLYGLDSARKEIRDVGQAVIVEGYMGVIGPYQHGFRNIVAQMGTALTEYQLRILKKYTDKFILALDSDAAGQKATLRGLTIAREALDRTPDMVFDARGLLHHEARLKADIRVLTLPEGMDPDDVVNQNPDQWQELINTAQPVVAHVMDTLAREQALDDPKVKSAIASQVLPLIDDIPNSIERDAYFQRLSRMLEINESALLSYRPERKKRPALKKRAELPAAKDPSLRERGQRTGELYEAHCVGILLREPELIYKVDRELGKEGLSRFDEKDFQNMDFQILVKYIKDALEQSDEEPRDYVLHHLPDNFIEIVDELLIKTENLDPKADKVLEDLMRAFLNLRKWQIIKNNDHYRYLQEAVHQNGDYKALEYQKNISHYLQEKHKIDKAMKRYTSRSAPFNS